ncbi:hypothetical protein COY07_01345 [Candidatus Peregrinibacteria bacterium CG_4_10_14_0_2_um_filter_43_11]|nr:MAG: hypothetical protein COY07_01345 [Candidatus Peregrinibacteria bacterium CG_4_10_14_0_2_um_filter_43_11]
MVADHIHFELIRAETLQQRLKEAVDAEQRAKVCENARTALLVALNHPDRDIQKMAENERHEITQLIGGDVPNDRDAIHYARQFFFTQYSQINVLSGIAGGLEESSAAYYRDIKKKLILYGYLDEAGKPTKAGEALVALHKADEQNRKAGE